MRRLIETLVLPPIYLLILALIGWAMVLAFAGQREIDTAALDRSPRPDMATSPEWQGRSVVDGAIAEAVRPSEVR